MVQSGGPHQRSETSLRRAAEQVVARRRSRLERVLGRPLPPPRSGQVPSERRRYLLDEAKELYWNELSWEALTAEERESSELMELAFPGFLAFVDGLLLNEVRPDAQSAPTPRPQVVEDILCFLAERQLERKGATEAEDVFERQAAERLLDLVLYRLHMIPVQSAERLGLSDRELDD
ncbi:MAG: hypothetical protein ACRELV_17010 [Longimicrobiales bacterium]